MRWTGFLYNVNGIHFMASMRPDDGGDPRGWCFRMVDAGEASHLSFTANLTWEPGSKVVSVARADGSLTIVRIDCYPERVEIPVLGAPLSRTVRPPEYSPPFKSSKPGHTVEAGVRGVIELSIETDPLPEGDLSVSVPRDVWHSQGKGSGPWDRLPVPEPAHLGRVAAQFDRVLEELATIAATVNGLRAIAETATPLLASASAKVDPVDWRKVAVAYMTHVAENEATDFLAPSRVAGSRLSDVLTPGEMAALLIASTEVPGMASATMKARRMVADALRGAPSDPGAPLP